MAAKLGLHSALVQEKWVAWEDPGYTKVGNIQLARLMGADSRLDPSAFGIEHKDTLKSMQKELAAAGRKPYYIPAGASDHPLGGLGFARWAFEVQEQERNLGLFFDTVIVCAVTGSTMAGSKLFFFLSFFLLLYALVGACTDRYNGPSWAILCWAVWARGRGVCVCVCE